MAPTYFPLRWESTGDQWWYASPIDWAAANGHYDLVRELLRLDGNHLIKLASLRRIRRLETVWDDEEQYDHVAKYRSQVAQKLLFECESKKGGKNSLIRAGYGGWLLYSAASAGDLSFVQDLLQRDPLLVFGEGEYGVTDLLYAAARGKNSKVFRLLFDYAISPRFSAGSGKELVEHIGDIPSAYKSEMMNRAVHAAARGGNLKILKELLADSSDVLAYRDNQGSTILHAAAGRGQVQLQLIIEVWVTITAVVMDHKTNSVLPSLKYAMVTDHKSDNAWLRSITMLFIAAKLQCHISKSLLPIMSYSKISIFCSAAGLSHLNNSYGESRCNSQVVSLQDDKFFILPTFDLWMQAVKDLVASYDIINSSDNHGNTALHVAAHRGQVAVLEALILASPSSICSTNNAGKTFLHSAVTGFQNPSFRRLDRQIELMRRLVCSKIFNIEEIVNARDNDGRTALHLAIIGNIHSDLVQLLTTVRSVNVNIRDSNGMTPLDILRQRPRSASSEILTRQLISAGGIFACQDYSARRIIATHLRMRSIGSSPGTSFRIADTEIFLYTGIENASDAGGVSADVSTNSRELTQLDSTTGNHSPKKYKRPGSVSYAAHRLKRLLYWPKMKTRKSDRLHKTVDENAVCNSEGTPIPLRQRYSKASSLPNNKRTLSVRSNVPSPMAKKKVASGLVDGVMQAMPHLNMPRRSRSSSFSKSSVSSQNSSDIAGPSCSNPIVDDGTPNFIYKQGSVNKRSMNQYFCFGASDLHKKAPTGRQHQHEAYDCAILSAC
ncbi:hypothetical protein RJ639_044056 [Escallonia herrerae]|uniref:Uncharacterized protein n=1 Tax=Escallonia herrerae TaxID=1293975 RepID=A0AA89B7J5_9ASTE|nr:hypothetical protein RJ639_044056 [Escallonia herrerae]